MEHIHSCKFIYILVRTQREEKIGTPGSVVPASTMNMLPETYSEESWTRYRMSDVNAGSVVPCSLKGTVFMATLVSQSFSIRALVISDLKIPGDIQFTLILCSPSSNAMTYQQDHYHHCTPQYIIPHRKQPKNKWYLENSLNVQKERHF